MPEPPAKPASAVQMKKTQPLIAIPQIAQDLAREKVGSEIKLLVDQPYVARSEADAPEVDARVILSKTAPVGEFIWRKIIGSRGYDLVA